MPPYLVSLLKTMPNLYCTISIQWRKLNLRDFIKYTVNTGLQLDTCETICSKLDMMLITTKLYSMKPVWMTLTFTEGHTFTEKWELLHKVTPTFGMVGYVKEIISEKMC